MPFISSANGQIASDHFHSKNLIFINFSKKCYLNLEEQGILLLFPHHITFCNPGMWLLQQPTEAASFALPDDGQFLCQLLHVAFLILGSGVPWFLAKACLMDKPGLDVAIPSTALLNAP